MLSNTAAAFDANVACGMCAINRVRDIDEFDPGDVRGLFEHDARIAEYGPTAGPGVSTHRITSMDHDALAKWLRDLRNARLLPLGDAFLDGIEALLTFSEGEARARIGRARKRARNLRRYGPSDWETADLVAEVAAVAGDGRAHGRDVWFHCPLGTHEDRTASFKVDTERRTFKCFGCGVGGGVVAWRKLMEAAA